MRFEKELQQKEMRHEMKYRLSQLQKNNSAQQLQHIPQQTTMGSSFKHPKPQINVVELPGSTQNLSRSAAPTPSPLTPNSTEELLPMVDETQEEVRNFVEIAHRHFLHSIIFSLRRCLAPGLQLHTAGHAHRSMAYKESNNDAMRVDTSLKTRGSPTTKLPKENKVSHNNKSIK